MKVLFAVSNENISEAIIKKYKEKYNELITYKNVYYFNAVIKELQTNYTYDRIVISEDLEVFSNSNELSIDKFLLNKLTRIVDEGKRQDGSNIPIIFLASEKRKFGSQQLAEYYTLGIKDSLIGNDRTITKCCELLKNSRTKEQAREYYQIEVEQTEQKIDNNPVSTTEIKNILIFYRGIANEPDKFSDTFDRIVEQYNDEQLKYIIQKLPMTVKIILEQKNQNYRNLMSGKSTNSKIVISNETKNIEENAKKANPQVSQMQPQNQNMNHNQNQNMQGNFDNNNLNLNINPNPNINNINQNQNELNNFGETNIGETSKIIANQALGKPVSNDQNINQNQIENKNENEEKTKNNILNDEINEENNKINKDINNTISDDNSNAAANNGNNINQNEVKSKNINTNIENSNIENENAKNKNILKEKIETEKVKENDNLGNNQENNDLISEDVLSSYRKQLEENYIDVENLKENPLMTNIKEQNTNEIEKEINEAINNSIDIDNIKYDSKKDKRSYKVPFLEPYKNENKRIISFVGTSKSGVSFLINSSAVLLSSIGIKTAILDMTTNRNSYYLATSSDKELKVKASTCFEKLEKGELDGIEISKTLSVFTSEPDNGKIYSDAESMYKTLLEEYDLILVDTDFNTNFGYYAGADEIFAVQSLDILTMQPLTKHLKDLKDKNLIMDSNIKIVINKEINLKGLSRKMIVGGISTYNNPSMSFMTKLFDKDTVTVCTIPFDLTVYQKYLENIIYCKYDISGYPKKFIEELKILASLVYPKYKNPEQINNIKNDNYDLKIEEGVFHKIEQNSGNDQAKQKENTDIFNNQNNINFPNQGNNITQNTNQQYNEKQFQNPNQIQNTNWGQAPSTNSDLNPNPNLNSFGNVGGFYGFKHRAPGQNYQIDLNKDQANNKINYGMNYNNSNFNSNYENQNLNQNYYSNGFSINTNTNPNQNQYLNQRQNVGMNQNTNLNLGQNAAYNNNYMQYADTKRNLNQYNMPNNMQNTNQNPYYNNKLNEFNNMNYTNKNMGEVKPEKKRFSDKISESLGKMKNLFNK